MFSFRRTSVGKIVTSAFLCCWTKPLLSTTFCILGVIILNWHSCFLSRMLSGDPSDMKNMKHGFIKVIPDHHFTSDMPRSGEEVKDTLQCAVPPIIHYVWCDSNHFQYQHYLSVLSVYKLLQPTEIIFHYTALPVRDSDGYYQYFEDLARDLPNFFLEPIDDHRACSDNKMDVMEYFGEILNREGGIFVGVNVILSHNVIPYMDKQLSVYQPVSEFTSSGLIFMSPGALTAVSGIDITRQKALTPITCVSSSIFSNKNHSCNFVSDDLFPYQIFDQRTDFGELARSVGYGLKEALTPKPQDSLIPNIVHYIWLGKRPFDYFAYLSLLSSVFIQKAETVYIHGDHEPYGQHWEEAMKLPQVKFIFREFPHTVYGITIKGPSHASDYLRYDILLRYGGIYVDWDLIWVKELSESQRKYEAIACFDWPLTGAFPETFNMGIFGAKKGAEYVKFLIESFRFYIDSDFGYNAIRIPYKVYEQHPDSLFVDRHLQVICFDGICHPVWLPGYKGDLETNGNDEIFNWRTETNAVHWTYPDPGEFTDRETLVASSGMNAEIAKNVLLKAGQP